MQDISTPDKIVIAELTPSQKRGAGINTIDAVYKRRAVKRLDGTHILSEATVFCA